MKQLFTLLIIMGLFSFVCLIVSTPPLILWFVVSPFAIATVIFFLIAQLQPAEEGEVEKRNWIIIGGMAGIIGPLLSFSPLFGHIWFAVWPFSIVLLDSEFLPPILGWSLLICVIILNIGLFALLGLFLGTIVRGISRFINTA